MKVDERGWVQMTVDRTVMRNDKNGCEMIKVDSSASVLIMFFFIFSRFLNPPENLFKYF